MNPNNRVTYFAFTDARNKRVQFGIKAEDRTRHVYVIGKTGMGKSTLLENMAIQDIQNGEGLAFIDPHGKTAEYLLDFVPEHRIKDVLYFAPFDMEYPIAFNVMEDIGPDKRHLVVSGLMSAFKKIWLDAWSARMEYILQNTLLALLEYPGATLIHINKMLSDKDFRKKVVDNIGDPTVRSFWVDEFAKYTDRFAAEATPAIQNKVGQFTSNPLIRNIIGQEHSSFDLRKMMDEKKILIINLSKGLVGEGNANLLGSMLITKIYLAAMSRADAPESVMKRLPNFYLYVDEFQSFANESFANILSEARKYKLNLTMAHQYVEQMSEEVRSAVFGNVGTTIVFRVGSLDADLFEKEFLPTFVAEDFVNLGFAQIYLKLMIDGVSSQPFSATTMPALPKPDISHKTDVIEMSREQFGHLRKMVEDRIEQQFTSNQSISTLKEEHKKGGLERDANQKKIQESRSNSSGEKKEPVQPAKNQEKNIGALREALAGVLGEPDLLEDEKVVEEAVSTPRVIEQNNNTVNVENRIEQPVANKTVETTSTHTTKTSTSYGSDFSGNVPPIPLSSTPKKIYEVREDQRRGGDRRDHSTQASNHTNHRADHGNRSGGHKNNERQYFGQGQNKPNSFDRNKTTRSENEPEFKNALRDVLKNINTSNEAESKSAEGYTTKPSEEAKNPNVVTNTQIQNLAKNFDNRPPFKKVASEEAGAGLRALRGVLEELKAKESVKQEVVVEEHKPEKKEEAHYTHKEERHESVGNKKTPVEIPEEELRKILDSEKDEKE